MFHRPGEATQTPTRPASASGRSRSVLLVLALLAAVGAPLAGAAPVAAQAEARLELTPAKAVTEVNRPIQYAAYLIDANGRHLATTETTLDFGRAPCAETRAAPGEVSCSDNGLFHVTGFERYSEVSSKPVELRVVNGREGPGFTAPPAPSPPNREVTVEGSTGSCGQTGTLSSDQLEVDQEVASGFTAGFRIPPGTFVGRHPLRVSVSCDNETQEATVDVTVTNQPPDAVNDHATTAPQASVTIPVTRNDTDPDGDDGYRAELEVDQPPTVGRAAVQGQEIVYTPGAGFVDGDQFTYRNCEVVRARGKRDCDTATVTITRPDPVPVDDEATTESETEVPILVTGNDTSPDVARLRVRTTPEHGQAVVRQKPRRDGHISYTPNEGFTDTDRFTYDYCEGVVGPNVADPDVCPFATVTVTVTEGKPVPVDDPDVTTVEGRTVDIDVMGNDRNGDAGKLEITPVQPRPKGTPAVLSNGKIQYQPAEGLTGKDSFQYDYCGPPVNLTAREDCPSATVTVDVQRRIPPAVKSIRLNPTPPNRQVVVTGTTGSCPEGTLTLLIPPGTVVAPVRAGPDGDFTASLEVPGGTLVETYPLTLEVDCDDQSQTDEARLQVANEAPDAVDDSARTPQDTPVTIDVTGNDTDPDGDEGYKTSLEATQPLNGRAEELSGGQIRYTPNPRFTGEDPFTYTFCDVDVDANGGKDCDKATVTVTVTAERRPVDPAIGSVTPEASPPNHEVVVKGTTGTCAKAARLTLDSAPRAAPEVPVTGGPDGGFEARLMLPPATYVGPYRLRLHAVCDGQPTVVEHQLRVANRPPQAADDTAATTMDTPVTIDVTGNDVDPDGDDGYPTALEPGTPAHGTAVEQPGNRIRYSPATGFTGEDRFPYRFCDLVDADGRRDCGAATVVVRVGSPPPQAVDDAARTLRDQPVTIEVTGNDLHPDPAKLHLSRPPAPPATAVEQRQPPGGIRYTPAPGFTGTDTFQYDYCGGAVVVDAAGRAACPPATVTVTVAKPDPVPVDDADVTTVAGQPVVVDVMGNDRDPDPSRLRLRPDPPARGRPEPLPDGRVRYTPEPGQAATDTFRYDYCRGVGAAAQAACPFATVTVTVTADPVIASVRPRSSPPGRTVQVAGNTGSCARAGTLTLSGTGAAVGVAGDRNGGFTAGLAVPAGAFPGAYRLELLVDCGGQARQAEATLTVTNRAPEAVDDRATTTRDQPATIDVAGNDRDPDDPDGHRTLVLVTSRPAHGTAEVQPDRTILYRPAGGFVGQDRFGYSLCDDVLNAAGGADCGAATVSATVTDTPVISSVTPGSTPPGQPVQVVGNTGSCSRLGTLIFHGPVDLPLAVSADANGSFAAGLTVPAGTFPQPYRLELRVDCGGRAQRAEATLTVTNQAPVAVDDPATTTPNTPVTVDVAGNDRDPDDPDGYQDLVLVTSRPAHGTAEEQPDQTIVYTPDSGFVGQDRFGYRLCDNVLNAAGEADCGSATVAVTVSATACVPAGTPRLEVTPGKGTGGTRLRITAVVDRRLAACPLRLFLGGTPLDPDVRVGGDGSISADRGVPKDVKPGRSSLWLATQNAQTLAEQPFEVVGGPIPWPVRLALGAGALVVGALARTVFRRWRAPREPDSRRPPAEQPEVRAEPHTRPVEVDVEPVPDGTRTFAVRLQPHADPGTQTLHEVTR